MIFDVAVDLHVLAHDVLCGRKCSHDRSRSGTFRAYQVDLRSRISSASLEVPVGSADSDSVCCRCLADRAARAACDLKDPDSCCEQHIDITVTHQLTVSLFRSDRTGAAHVIVDMMSFEHESCFCDICIARIRTASDKYLLNALFLCIL